MSEAKSGVVDIESIDKKTLGQMIRFLYTAEIEITANNVQSLYEAAHHVQIWGIKQGCAIYMADHLSADNCIGVYKFAHTYNETKLKELARQFIKHNFQEVIQHEEFVQLSSEEFILHFASTELVVDCEDYVLQSVMKWYNHDKDSRKANISEIIGRCVHLPFCSTETILETLHDNSVFREATCETTTEMLAQVLQHLRQGLETACIQPRESYTSVFALGLGEDKTGNKYSRRKKAWIDAPDTPYAISNSMAVCAIPSGILVTGVGQEARQCILYDKKLNCWQTTLPFMLESRRGHQAVACKGSVYIMGGEKTGYEFSKTVEKLKYSPTRWEFVQPMLMEVKDHSAVLVDEMIYVFGGMGFISNLASSTLSLVQQYNPANNTWTQMINMPYAFANADAAVLSNTVYLLATLPDSRALLLSYLPSSDTWVELMAPPKVQQRLPMMVWNCSINLLTSYHCDMCRVSQSTVYRYDPDKDRWSESDIKLSVPRDALFTLETLLPVPEKLQIT